MRIRELKMKKKKKKVVKKSKKMEISKDTKVSGHEVGVKP
jgi:hypothetical protein